MNIAKVIVDVPASTVNQTFDYNIPKKFRTILEPGMRVIIPFGPRKITGFVIERIEHSHFENLRNIIDVLDLNPVLTNELLDIGKWLSEETLALQITTYQAMLPQVLKSTYKKELVKCSDSLPSSLLSLFKQKDRIDFEQIENMSIDYKQLQDAIENDKVKIEYIVKSRVTKKYETIIHVNVSREELKEELEKLPKNATRQQQILQFFIQHNQSITQQKLYQLLDITRAHLNPLLEKKIIFLEQKEVYRNPYDRKFEQTNHLTLTPEQDQAIRPIYNCINENKHNTFLLHGVTGSGKTEVYLQAIDKVINKGKQAIVLVPEIALTPQMVERFKGRFGSAVAVLHSALSVGEKYDEWRKVLKQEVKVVVGARSAIFAPFKNLGIIIIDEEHETTYKQEEQPRYHARDVAIKRAKLNNCPIILGSATPTLESFARANKGVYQLLTLSKRTNKQPMPHIEIVDMREELHAGNRTMFSRTLMDEIKERLDKKEQIVLLLNRRGYSTFALCRDCGHVEECPNCDISLTYHKRDNRLKCHYCTYEQQMLTVCTQCESDLIGLFGTGTQRVEEALTKLIPEARVIRMDVDTTRRKGAHEKLLTKFENYEADILLGTQMIAKGLDFKNVTLVGVLAADSMLHLPDFRSSEKTFQLLTQVSGRAGRHELAGEVIVQTYTPEHYSITLASEYDFNTFYEREMMIRRQFQYPPYVYLVMFTISDENHLNVIDVSQIIATMLKEKLTEQTTILGPTPSPIARIKNRFRYQIIVKYKFEQNLQRKIAEILHALSDRMKKDLQIHVDINPYQFM